jgi:hypothetical protein
MPNDEQDVQNRHRSQPPDTSARRRAFPQARPQLWMLSLSLHASRTTRHVFEERRENQTGGRFQHPA